MPAARRSNPAPAWARIQREDQLNLATALLRSGFMPFLALFLHTRGLGPASIGMVMAVSSIVGLAASVPCGALVDRARDRPVWLLIGGALAVGAPLLLVQAQNLVALLCAVAMLSVSEALIAPALLIMNIEGVSPDVQLEQLGRNQAFGHFGKVAGLMLSGLIGSGLGFSALIAFEGLYLVFLMGMIWRIRPGQELPVRTIEVTTQSSAALIWLALALGLFQLGNAALPVLLGLSLADSSKLSAPVLSSSTAIIAQVSMVVGSILVVPILRRWHYWPVFAASFATLPMRCLLAALLPAPVAIVPVEILHGLGEAAQLVAIGAVIGDPQYARGKVGTRFGGIMLLQKAGGAASPILGGYVAEHWTSTVAYLLLGAIGLLSLSFWIACRPKLTGLARMGEFRLA